MTTIWFNLYSLSPEIYLLLSIAFLLIYGVLVTNSLSLGFPVLNQNLGWLSLLILVLTFWLVYSQPVIFLLT